jgi:putative glycosyltransferase (TIGR04372 family)
MNWFVYQWSQIRRGGWLTFQRKARALGQRLTGVPAYVIHGCWAIPAVLVLRALRPVRVIRLAILDSKRIGHFTIDACVFLGIRAHRAPDDRTLDVFWFQEPTCNEQWARMVRRELMVRWWVRYLAFFNRLVPGGGAHQLTLPTRMPRRELHRLPERYGARFTFTADETKRAMEWLRRRGWTDGEPFVGLLVRDSAYLQKHVQRSGAGSHDWAYHDYRDSDIATYVDAIRVLVERGYWVICLGKVAHQRVPFEHPRVIDYRFADDQDDLLDIWLSLNCRFFISTGTGIDVAAGLQGVPVLFVNAVPLSLSHTELRHIWVPKHLRWRATGQPLTLRELCLHRYGRGGDYADAGIEIEPLSPAEISAAVLECEARATGRWIETPEDELRQRRYWEHFRRWPDFHRFHADVHPEARVGADWLRSMGDAFFTGAE